MSAGTPADRIRAAAQTVRELAAGTSLTPWKVGIDPAEGIGAANGHLVVELYGCGDEDHIGHMSADLRWIAALSPAVAEPLYRLFDLCTGRAEDGLDAPIDRAVLALADALGGEKP